MCSINVFAALQKSVRGGPDPSARASARAAQVCAWQADRAAEETAERDRVARELLQGPVHGSRRDSAERENRTAHARQGPDWREYWLVSWFQISKMWLLAWKLECHFDRWKESSSREKRCHVFYKHIPEVATARLCRLFLPTITLHECVFALFKMQKGEDILEIYTSSDQLSRISKAEHAMTELVDCFQLLRRMKSGLRVKMEREIEELQDRIVRDDEEMYFRELEADRIRRQLQLATYHSKFSGSLAQSMWHRTIRAFAL